VDLSSMQIETKFGPCCIAVDNTVKMRWDARKGSFSDRFGRPMFVCVRPLEMPFSCVNRSSRGQQNEACSNV
jgi:hypothetical protein